MVRAEKSNILYFFYYIVELALRIPNKPGWSNPCSYLIQDLIIHQENFLNKVMKNDGDFYEYRMNGAGLKAHWRIRDDKFQIYISGDQAKDYPEFVEQATQYIRRRGANHR